VSCGDVQNLIEAHLDGKLDLVNALAVEQHLASCAVCTKRLEHIRSLRGRIAAADLNYRAPARLAERVRASLPSTEFSERPEPRMTAFRWGRWAFAAAALLAVVAVGRPWLGGSTGVSPSDDFIREVVADHVRSLQAKHLVDVASEDRHTVKPWFAGRLEFSPLVADLMDKGIPLVGGRVDVLDGQPAAALVYQHGKHVVNLFVQPIAAANTKEPAAIEAMTLQAYHGYHVISWTDSGLVFTAVSDLNESELREFAEFIKQAVAPSR
jgi:anti-sigma factor RsiW